MKIVLDSVSKYFYDGKKKQYVFKNINYEFQQKKSYSIVGESGSGKSTLLHLLGKIDTPNEGKVEIVEKAENQDNFAFIFQEHNLISELSIWENIALPKIISNTAVYEAKQEAWDLLKSFDLIDKKDFFTYQLSGGQRQKVAILRAIISKPAFIIADEPTANLDKKSAENILETLLEVHKNYKIGLIISSHDPNVFSRTSYQIKIQEKDLVEEKNS